MAGESSNDNVEVRTLDGDETTLPRTALEPLRAGIRGGVLTAGEPGYDEARRIWNAMIDHRPAVIARCLSSRDVRYAVGFAREHHILLSVRGGGHHIAGNAVAEGGLTIDLSPMRTVHVQADERTARVGGGALLGDVDHETQAFGLATPSGINSTTGFGGLCLGGGFGWLTRKYGLTIDNLISVDVVTADGELRVVSASREPDLFWAIRGGGATSESRPRSSSGSILSDRSSTRVSSCIQAHRRAKSSVRGAISTSHRRTSSRPGSSCACTAQSVGASTHRDVAAPRSWVSVLLTEPGVM